MLLLPAPGSAAPTIQVKDGGFEETATGRPFFPIGFTYTRLGPWHVTMNPGVYDSAAAEALFSHMAAGGFNVVRFWLGSEDGMEGPGPYSEAMLGNILDFLKRARRHAVYAMPVLEHQPQMQRYRALLTANPPSVSGENALYLNPSYITAFRQFLIDLLTALKTRDPASMDALFAIDIQNECHFELTGPFAWDSGPFLAPNGKTYHMEIDKRRLADEAAAFWVDALADAIHSVVPDLPVDMNVFTFAAVNRSGPDDFHADPAENRIPFDSRYLAASKASFLDIHFYAPNADALRKDFRSIGLDSLRTAAARNGKPLFVGEFGTFKNAFPRLTDAAAWEVRLVDSLHAAGFKGFLGWTYDTFEQEDIWNAEDGAGTIFSALSAYFSELATSIAIRDRSAGSAAFSIPARSAAASMDILGRKSVQRMIRLFTIKPPKKTIR